MDAELDRITASRMDRKEPMSEHKNAPLSVEDEGAEVLPGITLGVLNCCLWPEIPNREWVKAIDDMRLAQIDALSQYGSDDREEPSQAKV